MDCHVAQTAKTCDTYTNFMGGEEKSNDALKRTDNVR